MRRTRLLVAVGAVAALAVVGAGTAASAAASVAPSHFRPPADSLRALAAKSGLRIGTAIIPFDLDTPAYAQIAGDQFSTVTPGNEMKWQVVEPTQGTYDWSGGDRLVTFAQQHDQLVRGHTLLWHNQLPTWLTDGVASGDHRQRPTAGPCSTSTSPTRSRTSRARSGSGTSRTSSSPTPGTRTRSPTASTVTTSGSSTSARASSPTPSAGPTRPTRTRCCSTTTSTSPARTAPTPRATPSTHWVQQQLRAQGVPIDGIGNQGHLDTQYGYPTQLQQDLQRYAGLGLKVAITEADVRTFVNNATDQQPTDNLAAVRPAVRVLEDAHGVPRRPGVHLVHRVGFR